MASSGKDSVYSSDDEVVRPVVKRKKKSKTIVSSSDSDGDDSDIEIRPKRIGKRRKYESEDENTTAIANEASSCGSDSKNCSDALNDLSDNEQVDKCAICLSKFLGQDIATPEACDHVFCLECLQEWAKNVNTCPIDRLKFNLILIRHHKEEKVIKTIIVNNSELLYCSDVESESNAQSQVDYCDLCGEDENDESILRCQHCRKFYHYNCVLSALHSWSSSWQCLTCENYISLRNKYLDAIPRNVSPYGSTYGINPCIRDLPSLSSARRARSSASSITQSIIRQRILYNRYLLSTSESSDKETECSSVPSRLYQSSVISSISKTGCPLLTKRRNEICRTRNRALVSSAATATTESRSLFNEDSGDAYNDLSFSSTPVPENYDLVGSILQSQTLLHCPDVLTLTRDGSLLRNSKQESSPRRPSANTSSPMQNSEESSQSSLHNSSFFSDNTVSPYTGSVVAKQRPLNPTQNNTSKYGETPKQTHSCTSSGASMERSLNYNENTVTRLPLGANSNDRYNNESCSPIVPKGFCSSSTSDDIKKERPNKGHHSEDEVDIYSDIESVGEEDGSMSDRVVEPMKISFKCEDSQLTNPNDASDSSDNDLVIDEDMHVEEDDDKLKDNQESYNANVKHKSVKNNQINCESEESNMSSNVGSDQEQLTIEENNPENPGSSFIDNSSDNCYNPVDESSRGVFQNEDSNNSKLTTENENITKNDSESDANPQESDADVQEYEENSVDSAKKSFQADTNTPCTSLKSSPKSCRGETSDGFEIQCDNSASNENSRYGENSCFEAEESKEVFEEASNQENENTCDSVSQIGENENLVSENNSNLSEATSQVEGNENSQNGNNSNFSFGSDQRNDENSEPDDFVDSNPAPESDRSPSRAELVNICNDTSMKSDDEEDNVDSLENASTPCLDENLDGQIENSPVQEENFEDAVQDFESASPQNTEDTSKEIDVTANEDVSEKMECESSEVIQTKSTDKDFQDNTVDLGIEDISDAGSDDLRDEFLDEVSVSARTEKEMDEVEQKVASLFSPDQCENVEDEGNANHSKQVSEEYNKCPSSQSNQSFEDHEEGEIIEERPVHRCNKKKKERFHEDSEYSEYAPRVNISDLPRIPKLKRDRDKDNVSEVISFENKRTSVLSRVDLGSADISWKRLSKHTRERSYRDGRPKDERLLYRERESRNKEKNSSDSTRRNDNKNVERRRDEKKQEVEKSKNEYESRSRKTEKNKSGDWNYTDREKRKSRKDKHSKDKHSKDKKEKDKYDKTKYSKDEDKYEREKLKEEIRYERDLRYDKEERFERIVYEKGKFKDKEHKSKHKDRKSESSKSSKDHSREKHKHAHSSDHFSDKQREREVRKIDDKLKIVVEQKESRKEKSKHKERKEAKHDKKQVVQRKVENERIPFTESTSIESKEIFAKGDSIIINVSFNRASSPKVNTASDRLESNSKDRKVIAEELDEDEPMGSDDLKSKSKHSTADKVKCSLDNSTTKRPATPPGKNAPVLSVSECYWQGGDDPDGNNTPTSDKSAEEICADDGNETGSPNVYEANNFSNSGSSPDVHVSQSVLKDSNSAPEEIPCAPDKETNASFSKESETFSSKRRSPRSPSPPSPADNDSYDPCEPTRSPSPPPIPPAPPLPTANPKPPPSPELPPLPPEPEPIDTIHDDSRNHKQIMPSEFANVSATMVSSAAQPITVHTQTSIASPLAMQSMMLPPPSFLSQVSSAANTMPNMSSLVPPRNGSFQMSSHPAVMLPSNHVQPVMGGNFVAPQIHGGSTLPPPPNPPNMPHMSSVPPPPPPPAGMTLLSQVRHPHLNVHPTLTQSSLLQSLGMAHGVSAPQLQLVHQLPPNLSGILANQSSIVRTSQNQLTSLPVSIANQQGSRMVFSQNQLLNHGALFQNQNLNDCNKTQGSSANLMPSHTQTLSASSSSQQKSEKHSKNSPSTEKNEVVDMEMDTPYSPAYSPSVDSVGDYSPTCSPIPSSPKNKDAFDSLFPADHQRTSEKRTHDAASANEKSKQHSASKKSKHEHKSDSKVRHSVRMQVKDKHKKSRKEHKQTDKKESVTKLEDSQLKILDELPSSAVEMQVKEKFLKKLNRQERVVEEVKFALKPYYKSRDVSKEEYKDILRKSVPKICHNKSGEINPVKVKYLVECYVKKAKHSRKKGDKKKSSALS